ncbi:MAG: hypothetical protein Q8R12_02405 [bacterium]|nr:hypothetical protein [bacterium]
MARVATIAEAKKIFGKNFIGPEELAKTGIVRINFKIPMALFSIETMKKFSRSHILILGMPKDKTARPLTLNRLRDIFGLDPAVFEPCFYNQDWYLKEDFASKKTLDFKWYLIGKGPRPSSRAKAPGEIEKKFKRGEKFPSTILAAFTFFSYWFITKEILWKHDFIWCEDKDANGDRIYVGRYEDFNKINKNGFNVHRHLSLRRHFGFVPQIS